MLGEKVGVIGIPTYHGEYTWGNSKADVVGNGPFSTSMPYNYRYSSLSISSSLSSSYLAYSYDCMVGFIWSSSLDLYYDFIVAIGCYSSH